MHDIIVSNLISSERERLSTGETRFEDREPFARSIREFLAKFQFGRRDVVASGSNGAKKQHVCSDANCACTPAH